MAKLDPSAGATGLRYSTPLGPLPLGAPWVQASWGNGIAVDNVGDVDNVYVTGFTQPSSDTTFPTTENAYQRFKSGGKDAFVVKLESSNDPPEIAVAAASVTTNEGSVATITGTYSDPDGDVVELSASDGTVTTSDGTWSWSFPTNDGPDDSRTVTITATDPDGAESSATFILTVNNVAPSVAAYNASVTVDEGETASNAGTFYDPGADTVSISASVGTVSQGAGTWSWSFGTTDGPEESQSVTITATDSDGAISNTTFALTVDNVVPVVGEITAPIDPVPVGTTITASADFTDPGTADTHTANWDWGDESTAGTVTETNGSGSVTDTHTYVTPGVYTVTLTVTDDDGDGGESTYHYVVVYDPDGGFVTGGGTINSPPGAYAADASLAGLANFGFVSEYKKGATVPTGHTEFQFHAAGLDFKSASYQWLVVAGARAQFKGTGSIKDMPGAYGFMLIAIDGAVSGGGGADRFRIKIWDSATEAVVYDNQMGAEDDAEATTSISNGSIVIHSTGSGS